MNKWSVVGDRVFINEVKNSKFFQQDLGESFFSLDTSEKKLRNKSFSTWYYKQTNSLIFKQGKIGNITFYLDYYLQKSIVGFFLESKEDTHQYAIDFDVNEIQNYEIDTWLGNKLQQVDSEVYESENKENQKEGTENIDQGDPEKVFNNPGEVSFKDLQAYYRKYKKNQK